MIWACLLKYRLHGRKQKKKKAVWALLYNLSIFSFIICVCSRPLFRGPAFGSLFWKYEWWCATPSKSCGIFWFCFFFWIYCFIIIILFLKSYLLKLFGVSFYKYKYNAPVCTYWRSLLIDSWRICFPFICLFLCLPSHLSLLSLSNSTVVIQCIRNTPVSCIQYCVAD